MKAIIIGLIVGVLIGGGFGLLVRANSREGTKEECADLYTLAQAATNLKWYEAIHCPKSAANADINKNVVIYLKGETK